MPDTFDVTAYDAWFDTGWGRYASQVELQTLLQALSPHRPPSPHITQEIAT